MLTAVKDRLEDQVPVLRHRVELATGFAELMRAKRRPSSPIAAYVAPVGLRGKPADVVSGHYSQDIQETLSVILFARGGTKDGDRALEDIADLVRDVIRAIAGWTPSDTVGLFAFVQSGVANWNEGILIYQWQFAIDDRLRITT